MKITLGSLATLSLAAGQCAFPDQRNIECATIISNDHSYYDQPYCVHTPDSTLPSGHKILCVVTTGVGEGGRSQVSSILTPPTTHTKKTELKRLKLKLNSYYSFSSPPRPCPWTWEPLGAT